ncbi:hypothetical protein GCM10012275_38220 [Longimycelium tulufanense]|uniref:Siphovirus-type tail component C-terminal domain-containing protein n=1 Tax=Longimycelium tulufanense TaxID=907463 RepID=A0A8J3FVI7_9PSEU|nr:phage tail domain-containing protein [Longimycelium tulufanense]GGM64057.1 hypothetical protein GCM10012275_38220 [Longimycelium tulufanense]
MAETVIWIDPDGATTTLEVNWSTRARFAPPIAFEEEGVPEQPGSRLRAVRHATREFVLPLWISDSSESALRTTLRDLVKAMDPARGDGTIRVTAPGGDQREIVCRYAGGLELDEILGDTSGPLVQRTPVVFRAFDPYWRATSDTVDTYTTGTTATFFPFFPIRLSSSEVFADPTVNNVGDVEAWPVWTITGPGSNVNLKRFTGGETKTLTLSTTLGAGETAEIDTRPGKKTVTKGDGTNLFGSLSSSSVLWPLLAGDNPIRVEMTGSTSDSSVKLAFRPRYLTA